MLQHTKTILLGAVLLLTASAMEVKENCFDCANTNGGNNFMCNYGGNLPTKNYYAVACCNPGDSHEYCQESASNVCSPKFNDERHHFYTYCPLINSTGCGIPNK